MLMNYVKTALRNFFRHKGYSFIILTGLAIGIASCIIIFHYVSFEYSFDRFHENNSNLYRITSSMNIPGQEPGTGAFTGFALAPALKESVPEIRYITRVHPEYSPAIISNPERPDMVFEEKNILYADQDFLRMFSFPLEVNNNPGVFERGSVLLSPVMAQKYFNNSDPRGKLLKINGMISKTYRVAGVFSSVPENSHLRFDFLLPMEDLLDGEDYTNEPEGGWSWNNFSTYVLLHPKSSVSSAEKKMTETYLRYRGDILKEQGITMQMNAQPLNDIHLNSEIEAPTAVMGDYKIVYFFSVVGLITLIIALVNYVNLATARSANRTREVGLRKVVGAHKKQLMIQFLSESAVTIFISAVTAVMIVELVTPEVNSIAGTNLSGIQWNNPLFWIIFFVLIIICAAAAGLYPAFVLSSFKPVNALKGRTGSFKTQLWLRRVLVVIQFAASVILIGGTIVVYDQLNFMRNIDIGLDIDRVLIVNGPGVLTEGTARETAINTFTYEINRIPAVIKTSASSTVPGQGFNWNGAAIRKSTDLPSNSIRGVVTYIDTGFASLYGLELIAGSGFNSATVSPGDSTWYVLMNQTAARSLGYKSPADAAGQLLNIGGYDAHILGVYKDFSWSSAHTATQNIIFGYSNEGNTISVKTGSQNLNETIKRIEELYHELFPGNVFKYSFIDESFDEQYKNDQRFASLFTIFAGLAILIASLGLYGLADFMTKQRTKEIGIRKVLGATVPEILILLTKDFLTLVIISIIIASPFTYYLMRGWLDNFAYRITIGAKVFLFTAAVIVIIALFTVSYQSIKTALLNPVKSLKHE